MTKTQLFNLLHKEHSNSSTTTLRRLLCGKEIGSGVTRTVYECKLNPSFVVKVQFSDGFHNAIEKEIWDAIQYCAHINKWFAECLFISRNGTILVQQKVFFDRDRSRYPKKLPWFFTDHKIENYGYIGNQIKCVDYGNVLMMLTGKMTLKKRRVKWHQDKKSWDSRNVVWHLGKHVRQHPVV